MDTVTKRLYEGLFLVDSGQAASDWEGTTGAITRILARSDVDIVSLRKWDERKLAYEVQGKPRGTYILVYFNSDPLNISAIERDAQLSEQIMRVMILRAENFNREDVEKDTPAMIAEKQEFEKAEMAEEAAEELEEEAVHEAEVVEEAVEEAVETEPEEAEEADETKDQAE